MKSKRAEKGFLIVLIGVFLILLPCMGYTAIPQEINYQGYLTSAAGVPVNGTVAMVFRIYNVASGGTELWNEAHNVTVNQGVYNVILGASSLLPNPITLPFDQQYYLGVKVGTDPEMTPRIPLTSVGYAFRAQTVESVGSHTHSGADITSGTVLEPRIDSAIARTAALNAHTSNMNNPHSTTAAQVGASPAIHSHSAANITSGTLDNARFSAYSDLAAEGYLGNAKDSDILTRIQSDGRYVNEGQSNSITSGMLAVPLSLSGSTSNYIISGSNSGTGNGVYGYSSGAAYQMGVGVGGVSDGAYGYGVWGECNGAGGTGVVGHSDGSNGYGVNASGGHGGVYAQGGQYGVYGYSTQYAGYFSGDVGVTGTLVKTAGSFKIDHPLDPENKYLYHSFVESPDMKNIYDGVVTLDSGGEAWVELPEWFGALNKDFRYQLTCIGGFAQVYIAEEVSGNRFKIAGGTSGLKVSWQVTGIRKDPYAEAHRIPVEELKKPEEQGYYIHPDLHRQPEEKSIEWAHHPEMMKKMKAERERVKRSNGK